MYSPNSPLYIHSKKQTSTHEEAAQHSITKKIRNYNFKLSDVIGKGAFSTVYKGHQELTEEVVAIKVVELNKIQSPTLLKLLYSQVDILKSVKHPNVLKCLDVYFSVNNCYIVTEYCNGGDLRSTIAKYGQFKQESANKIVLGIYEGLKYLAEEHIVHRDLKTANVFIKDGQPKIADFGFAKRTMESFKDVNIGSPLCMSPEGLIDNIYGQKTDVWAFGVMLYEIFHAKTPFGHCKTQQQLKSTVLKPIRSQIINQQLSYDLRELILSCLQIKIDTRISMQQIEYTQYIERIRQSLHVGNLLVSQVEEYRVDIYDSSVVSTEVPIQTERTRGYQNEVNLFEDEPSYSQIKLKKDKSSEHSKFDNFSFKFRSPRQSKLPLMPSPEDKKIAVKKVNFKDIPKRNRSEKPETSLDFGDRKLTIISIDKNKKLNSTISNFRMKDSSPSKVFSPRAHLLQNLTEFDDILAILHYCRILFKTVKVCQKCTFRKLDYLGSWMFKLLDQIIFSLKKIAKPSSKIQQLKDIVFQYSDKYRSQLPFSYKPNLAVSIIQSVIAEILTQLQSSELEDAITAVSYLVFLYDITELLEKAAITRNFRYFAQNNQIEQFLEAKEKVKGKEYLR